MDQMLKIAVVVALVSASADIAPAIAQSETGNRQVRIRTPIDPAVIQKTRAERLPPPTESETSISKVPKVKVQQAIKAGYYCIVDVIGFSAGEETSRKQIQFTISALDDGSLVYGGTNPMNSSFRYELVDDGEWRLMKVVGWIDDKSPADSTPQPSLTKSKTSGERIHRSTGEFKATSKGSFGGITFLTTYTGTCSGNV